MIDNKFGWSKYNRPTPKKWRQLGDGLLAFSAAISTYAISEEMKCLALTAVLVGALGKFLTNFFAE